MTSPESEVPKVYRVMKRDVVDGLPVLGSTSSELGVRPGMDVAVDGSGDVILDGSGMSVVPDWRVLGVTRVPKRLKSISPGAVGPNNTACYTLGVGPFVRAVVAAGLELIPDIAPDPVKHGVLAPLQIVSIVQYDTDLEATRADWHIDET